MNFKPIYLEDFTFDCKKVDLKSIFVSSITKYLNEQHVTFYICWGSSGDNLCEFYVLDAQRRLYPWFSSLSCWRALSSIILTAYFLKRANTERKITVYGHSQLT